jgi:hypothetical protein
MRGSQYVKEAICRECHLVARDLVRLYRRQAEPGPEALQEVLRRHERRLQAVREGRPLPIVLEASAAAIGTSAGETGKRR